MDENQYAYYIFVDKFLGLDRFGIPLNAGKHEGWQQIADRVMLTIPSLSYAPSHRNQTIKRSSIQRALTSVITRFLTYIPP